ncbi:TPA: tail fiber protein [Providencia stuartii]
MSVIKKPDLKIFAQDAKTGEIETFPDVLRGWGITLDRTAGKPPLEWFNAIGKRVDEWLMYLTQRGVAEWDATLSYPKTAIVQWNGVIYVSNKETKGEQPDKSQAAWSTLGVFLGLGNYYTKTDTDTKFQLKGNYALKGESYTKVESDTRFQPKGNYLPSGYSYSKSESDTKYQPKGNYAPAGDYATNTALKNGLNGKFDKTGGNIEGLTRVKNTLGANMVQVTGKDDAYMQLDMSVANVARINSKRAGKQWCNHILPDVSGTIMQVGDYGWGGKGAVINLDEKSYVSFLKGLNTESQIFRNSAATSKYHYQHGVAIYGKSHDTYTVISADYVGKGVIAIGGNSNTFYEYNLYSDRNTAKDYNGNLKVSGSSSELSDYPVGAPIPWPQATAPSGYLICNGQTFNKTTYPLLAKAYPSGVLPDLRGEFIRGLDAGRNIDNGRVVLSAQTDAIQNIKGEISISSEKTPSSGSSGAFTSITANGTVVTSSFVTRQIQKFSFDASNSARTANETRPRNIAFLYIVRAA